jgi:hypothetical protein
MKIKLNLTPESIDPGGDLSEAQCEALASLLLHGIARTITDALPKAEVEGYESMDDPECPYEAVEIEGAWGADADWAERLVARQWCHIVSSFGEEGGEDE